MLSWSWCTTHVFKWLRRTCNQRSCVLSLYNALTQYYATMVFRIRRKQSAIPVLACKYLAATCTRVQAVHMYDLLLLRATSELRARIRAKNSSSIALTLDKTPDSSWHLIASLEGCLRRVRCLINATKHYRHFRVGFAESLWHRHWPLKVEEWEMVKACFMHAQTAWNGCLDSAIFLKFVFDTQL